MLALLQAQRLLHPVNGAGLLCRGRAATTLENSVAVVPPAITWLAGGFCLHNVEATLLGTLQARVAEQRERMPLLHDAVAPRILQQLGCALRPEPMPGAYRRAAFRSATIDCWVGTFLAANDGGTIVEIGVGLNTRFERLDAAHGAEGKTENGRWIEIDLPRVNQLRKHVLEASTRRQPLAASITALDWLDVVAASPGPYCFVAEALLGYLAGPMVRWVLEAIASRFPGATIIFDTHPRWHIVAGQLVLEREATSGQSDQIIDAIAAWSTTFKLLDTVPLWPQALLEHTAIGYQRQQARWSSVLTRWVTT